MKTWWISCGLMMVLVSALFADEAKPFVDTPVGQSATGLGWIIVLQEAEGRTQYSVLVRGDANDWHVFLADLPKDINVRPYFGQPVMITAKVGENRTNKAVVGKLLQVTKINPIKS